MTPEVCPYCLVCLLGDPIPEVDHHFYAPPYFFKRVIGIEYPELYDGVWLWKCPDCLATWPSEVAKLKGGWNENE
jgi:hypothetical protein